MITIHQLLPPENLDLFERFPALNRIWELPALQRDARKSYERWRPMENGKGSTGEIFSIVKDGAAIGITGWFEFGEFPKVLRLRYHGLVPGERGKGYGERSMELLLSHLSTHAPEHCNSLAESVSICRKAAPAVIAHFRKMGFREFADPNYGSNAGCGEVQSLKIQIPGRF